MPGKICIPSLCSVIEVCPSSSFPDFSRVVTFKGLLLVQTLFMNKIGVKLGCAISVEGLQEKRMPCAPRVWIPSPISAWWHFPWESETWDFCFLRIPVRFLVGLGVGKTEAKCSVLSEIRLVGEGSFVFSMEKASAVARWQNTGLQEVPGSVSGTCSWKFSGGKGCKIVSAWDLGQLISRLW